MIQVKNLSIEYKLKLFDNISFVLGNKDKIGLVGLNGSGKTTLLRIIMGLETPDKGSISIVNEKVEYLPQEYSFEDMMVGEFLESLVDDHRTQMYRVNIILKKLNFDVDIFQEVNTLSEGQKMKLYLTKLLINNPTVLLLDEPTNHLDIEGIDWFESFIKNFDGICVIISHDREFLNNTVNKIYEIDEHQLYVFDGNYDEYLDLKVAAIEERAMRYRLQEKHREKMENLLEMAKQITDGKKRGKKVRSAKKRMEREITKVEISDYKKQEIKNLIIKGEVHKNKTILNIKDVSFSYNQSNKLLDRANLILYGQDKVWMYGANGIGKSTLVKLIIGELKPDSGEIKIGENLKWAYFSQDQSHLPLDETLEDYFITNTGISHNESFSIMQNFLFDKEMRKQKIGKLSPGQRARLSFAVFSRKEYDFLILDEPTNHLDIRSKEVIEQSLKTFKGTILLISHDRYFVNQLEINRVITIEDKSIIED